MHTITTRARLARLVVPLVVLSASTAGCDIAMAHLNEKETAEWRRTYELQPGGRVEISNVNGKIDVEPSTGNTVEVVAEKTARAAAATPPKRRSAGLRSSETVSPASIRIETKVQKADWRTDEPRQPAGALHRQGAGRRRGELHDGQRRHRAHRAEGPDQRRDHQRRRQGARSLGLRSTRARPTAASTSTSRSCRRRASSSDARTAGSSCGCRATPKATISASITNGGINTQRPRDRDHRREVAAPARRPAERRRRPHRYRGHQRRHHASPAADVSSRGDVFPLREPPLQQSEHGGFGLRQILDLPRPPCARAAPRSSASIRPGRRRAPPGGCSTCGRRPCVLPSRFATDSIAWTMFRLACASDSNALEVPQQLRRQHRAGPGAEVLRREVLAGDLLQVRVHVGRADRRGARRRRRGTGTARARESRHALTMRASRRSSRSISCSTPLLPRNAKRTRAAVTSTCPSRIVVRPNERFCSRVLVVADADQRLLEQLHDRRQHLLARQPRASADPRSVRRRIAASACANAIMRSYFVSSRTSRQRG